MIIKGNTPVAMLLYLAGGFMALLAISFLLVLPTRQDAEGLRRQIAETEARIEEAKLLDPLYAQLTALQKAREELALPPVPPLEGLAGEVGGIAPELEQVSRRAGMKLVSATPSPASLEGGSDLLLVELVIEGDYPALRELLLGLLEIPYLQAVSSLQIREIIGGREYTLQLLLKLGK
ncbi:hypothetical protein ACHHRT_09425 [Desulfurivibrio sp. D14AmB]|uniref:hypothetical protein n=1 Tax=Desulfurivibrio sp. D14AmB TaxID=3374370 RepID=UPI00376EC287